MNKLAILPILLLLGCNKVDTAKKSSSVLSETHEAPAAPTGITLLSPGHSPHINPTPTFIVSGVASGQTVELYADSTCSTQVASGIASGTTIDLTTISLPEGVHNFFAKVTDGEGLSSICSTASATYKIFTCPTNYVHVVHNDLLGTEKDFCVMKYEARALKNDTDTLDTDGCLEAGCTTANWASVFHPATNTTGYRPVSVENGQPWRRIDFLQAKEACENLGTGFALMNNEEWMTLARSIELVDENWAVGSGGTELISRGFTNPLNTAPALSSQASCLYNTGANLCDSAGDWEYKRTHLVTAGSTDVIWDLSGNVWEWVDWQVPCDALVCEKAYVSTDGAPAGSVAREYGLLDTNVGATDTMKPETWMSVYFPGKGAADGLGSYYGGDAASGGYAVRGGRFLTSTNAGIFSLNLLPKATDTNPAYGFRCVYRP